MAKIYKRSDRITVKIDDITVKLGTLSSDQKAECNQYFIEGRAEANYRKLSRGTELTIKYGVKDITGLFDSEGKPYKLEFEGDVLTDECVDELLNIDVNEKLSLICVSLLKNIPKAFTDEKGNTLQGVSIVESDKGEDNSKNV